jgi:hypothetical protein
MLQLQQQQISSSNLLYQLTKTIFLIPLLKYCSVIGSIHLSTYLLQHLIHPPLRRDNRRGHVPAR